jgi:hypothetical protein
MDQTPTLSELSVKIDIILASVEKTRRYMQWTFTITAIALLLPLVAALIIVPFALSSYTASIETLM